MYVVLERTISLEVNHVSEQLGHRTLVPDEAPLGMAEVHAAGHS